MSTSESKQQKPAGNTPAPRRPNEQGTVTVQAHMRIFDPKTKKVYVEGRA